MKRRVYISDHGSFTMFDMNISLPAILELEEEQITYLKNTGLYNVSELNAAQATKAKETPFSSVDGDRFETARTVSVNELSFKSPILGTNFAKKAKDALVVKRNSIFAKAAMHSKSDSTSAKVMAPKVDNKVVSNKKETAIKVVDKVEDKTSKAVAKGNNSPVQPTMLESTENK